MFKTFLSFCILFTAAVLLGQNTLQARFDKLAARKAFGKAEVAELRAIMEAGKDSTEKVDCTFCPDAFSWYLASNGLSEEADWLFSRNADFGIRDKDGMTILQLVCRNGYDELAKLLIGTYGVEIDLPDNEGRTAIHYAAMSGNTKVMLLLLENGADPNKLTKKKDTPLHFAAKYAGEEEVRFLVEHGASIKAINWTLVNDLKEQRIRQDRIYHDSEEERITALKEALGLNTPESLQQDEEEEDEEEDEDYGGERYADVAEEEDGIFPKNVRRDKKRSIFDLEHIPVDLLPRDTNDAENTDGITALHCAAENGDIAVVKYLVEHGANVKAQDALFSRSAIHFAADKGNLECIRYLAEKGADLQDKDIHGATALHYAVRSGHLDAVKYLVDKKMDYAAKDVRGWSAMHYAACGGSIDIVKYLLAKGLGINDLTETGRTPLFFAKDRELRKFISSRGAK